MTERKFQRFSDRFFQVSPLYTRPGWYIKLREGKVIGPFPSKALAQAALFNLYGIADLDGDIVAQACETPSHYSGDSRK